MCSCWASFICFKTYMYCTFIMWTQQEAFTLSKDIFFVKLWNSSTSLIYFKVWIVHGCVKIKCWTFLFSLECVILLVNPCSTFIIYRPYILHYHYLAGCTMFPHLPAPIWQLYYLLPPVASVIPVFLHQSLFSHQSSNPFHPGKFRSTLFSSSWWMPFHHFFWQSSLFHSLNMSIPLKLFCFNIV